MTGNILPLMLHDLTKLVPDLPERTFRAIRFIEKGGKEAVIGSLSDALNVLSGKSGTSFVKS